MSAIDFLLDPSAVAQALHAANREMREKFKLARGGTWDDLDERERDAFTAACRKVVTERLASLEEEEDEDDEDEEPTDPGDDDDDDDER